MNVVFIVLAAWIALDVALVAALSHLSGRRGDAAGGAALRVVPSQPVSPLTSVSARSTLPVPAPRCLRLVGDPSSPAPEPRLRAVSHR